MCCYFIKSWLLHMLHSKVRLSNLVYCSPLSCLLGRNFCFLQRTEQRACKNVKVRPIPGHETPVEV